MLEFQTEIKAFEAALPALLEMHGGEYVVIHVAEVNPRTFSSCEEALSWGYEQFGSASFFVKQIADKSHTTHFIRGFAE